MADLAGILTAAYRPYLLARMRERGWSDVTGVEPAISDGERWLGDALSELLTLPFARQHRGPLEVFQEAVRFPTDALATAGIEPVPRDRVAVDALPGDLYDLAPASSRDLGEDVWQAHLRWGAAKAAALRHT